MPLGVGHEFVWSDGVAHCKYCTKTATELERAGVDCVQGLAAEARAAARLREVPQAADPRIEALQRQIEELFRQNEASERLREAAQAAQGERMDVMSAAVRIISSMRALAATKTESSANPSVGRAMGEVKTLYDACMLCQRRAAPGRPLSAAHTVRNRQEAAVFGRDTLDAGFFMVLCGHLRSSYLSCHDAYDLGLLGFLPISDDPLKLKVVARTEEVEGQNKYAPYLAPYSGRSVTAKHRIHSGPLLFHVLYNFPHIQLEAQARDLKVREGSPALRIPLALPSTAIAASDPSGAAGSLDRDMIEDVAQDRDSPRGSD